MTCFLAPFSDKPCRGRMDPAHLIAASFLRQELDEPHRDVVWDPRIIVLVCRWHHHAFDNRRLIVPRESLPAGVEEYAQEHQLSWHLDKRYGALVPA